jgi:hypothetical protein
VPPIYRKFDSTKHKLPKFGCREGQGDKVLSYINRAAGPSSFFMLDQEKVGVKLNESVIVKGKPMNRNQIFVSG